MRKRKHIEYYGEQGTVNLHPNLSDGSIFSEDVVHFFGGDFVRKISYV
jgi:hypothetical protein